MRYPLLLVFSALLFGCGSGTTPADSTPRVFHVTFDFSGDSSGAFILRDTNSNGAQIVIESDGSSESVTYLGIKRSERWGEEDIYLKVTAKGSLSAPQTFTSSDPDFSAHLTLAMPGPGPVTHPENIAGAFQSTVCTVLLTDYSRTTHSGRGTFTATLTNDSGKTLILTNGSFDFP